MTLAIEMIKEKAYFSIGNRMHLRVQLKNNCTSNSQVITQGKPSAILTASSTTIPYLHSNTCDYLLII